MNALASRLGVGRPNFADLRLFVVGTVVLVSAAALGGVLAAPTTISQGTAEQGVGAYVGDQSLAYWTWQSTVLATIPAAVPGGASVNPAAPSILPVGARSYTINAATAGHPAVRWIFQETTAAPMSTELELRFVVGLTNPAAHITVYVETQAAPPGAAHNYRFYWDAGAFAPTAITIETMEATVLACTAVGNCP
jgi:hypothetical protein